MQVGQLTRGQQFELMYDVGSLTGPSEFRNEEEYSEVWRRYGAQLLKASGPFLRPSAYWELDVGFVPECSANGYESEKSALLRLGLPLTAVENRLLGDEKK